MANKRSKIAKKIMIINYRETVRQLLKNLGPKTVCSFNALKLHIGETLRFLKGEVI